MPERLIRDSETLLGLSPLPPITESQPPCYMPEDVVEVRFLSEPLDPMDPTPAFGILAQVRIDDMKDGLTKAPSDCLFIGTVLAVVAAEGPPSLGRPTGSVSFGLRSIRCLRRYGGLNPWNPDRDSIIRAPKPAITIDPTQGGPWIPITPTGAKEPLLLCRDLRLAQCLSASLSALLYALSERS